MISNRKKSWIFIFFFSLSLLACNDFAEDMDRAINSPQSKIAYFSGLILDGNKDAIYDKIFSRLSDEQSDGNTSFLGNGTDLKAVYLVQDDLYLWLYLDLWDGSPNLNALPLNFRYEILLNDPYLYIQIVSSGGEWTILNQGSIDLSAAEFQVAEGIEVRVIKSLFINSINFLRLYITINDDNTFYDGIQPDFDLTFRFE